jgi:hydrogenase nickel incorporation protein HypB
MCEDCGCGETGNEHGHSHEGVTHTHDGITHTHDGVTHTHDGATHTHDHRSGDASAPSRTVELERRILSKNDEAAAANRAWLDQRGIVALNLISSPGAGKTFLLEKTLDRLRGRLPCAVITGDVQTDNDARRLRNRGAPVAQIETHGACHLDARGVGALLPEVAGKGARLLFIENIGNLVCPSAFDLGESFKIALLSTAEGEDKPAKYPALFSQAPVTVLTKMDLVAHLDWNVAACRAHLRRVRPAVFIFELSARTGQGMDAWIDYLEKLAPPRTDSPA